LCRKEIKETELVTLEYIKDKQREKEIRQQNKEYTKSVKVKEKIRFQIRKREKTMRATYSKNLFAKVEIEHHQEGIHFPCPSQQIHEIEVRPASEGAHKEDPGFNIIHTTPANAANPSKHTSSGKRKRATGETTPIAEVAANATQSDFGVARASSSDIIDAISIRSSSRDEGDDENAPNSASAAKGTFNNGVKRKRVSSETDYVTIQYQLPQTYDILPFRLTLMLTPDHVFSDIKLPLKATSSPFVSVAFFSDLSKLSRLDLTLERANSTHHELYELPVTTLGTGDAALQRLLAEDFPDRMEEDDGEYVPREDFSDVDSYVPDDDAWAAERDGDESEWEVFPETVDLTNSD